MIETLHSFLKLLPILALRRYFFLRICIKKREKIIDFMEILTQSEKYEIKKTF